MVGDDELAALEAAGLTTWVSILVVGLALEEEPVEPKALDDGEPAKNVKKDHT